MFLCNVIVMLMLKCLCLNFLCQKTPRPITKFELHKKEPTKLELQKNELTKLELHKLEPMQKRTLWFWA